MTAPAHDDTRERGTLWRTVLAVAWSFFGVRRSTEYAKDVQQLSPVHVVIGGLLGALLFIVALVLLVKWVISSGVAT
jgi:hypothetical protein